LPVLVVEKSLNFKPGDLVIIYELSHRPLGKGYSQKTGIILSPHPRFDSWFIVWDFSRKERVPYFKGNLELL